jgi:hypothetical protein
VSQLGVAGEELQIDGLERVDVCKDSKWGPRVWRKGEEDGEGGVAERGEGGGKMRVASRPEPSAKLFDAREDPRGE